VRHVPLPDSHPEVGHLIAARITSFEDAGRALYSEYLKRLAAPDSD
jgi:hypothetical protein